MKYKLLITLAALAPTMVFAQTQVVGNPGATTGTSSAKPASTTQQSNSGTNSQSSGTKSQSSQGATSKK